MSFFNSISRAFSGPAISSEPDMPLEPPVEAPVETTSSLNPKTVLTPRPLRPRNGPVAPANSVSSTTAPLARANNTLTLNAQSGGRRMRSKSKNLRPSLFRKYKYKMARRSMTMRKRCKKCGRKTCRGCKGTRKGSRRARR